MYGIELRERSLVEPRASAVRMSSIHVHYDDGRSMRFVPKRERNSSPETTWIG